MTRHDTHTHTHTHWARMHALGGMHRHTGTHRHTPTTPTPIPTCTFTCKRRHTHTDAHTPLGLGGADGLRLRLYGSARPQHIWQMTAFSSVSIMACPGWAVKIKPRFAPEFCKTYFPAFGPYEISRKFVCSVMQRTKSRVKLLCFYFGFWLSLRRLRGAVRVCYVCLLPRPAQLVAHLLPDEVVLT